MMNNYIVNYTLNGHRLTRLTNKTPTHPGWKTTAILDRIDESIKSIECPHLETHWNAGGNLGWVIGDHDLVIDVDSNNGGLDSFRKLENDLGVFVKINKAVDTSAGFQCYLSHPGKNKLLNELEKYPGIEFLTKGEICVIPGSTVVVRGERLQHSWHEENILAGFNQRSAPRKLLEMLYRYRL